MSSRTPRTTKAWSGNGCFPEVVAFLPTSHPLAAKPVLTPDDLAEETFVTYPRSANPAFYDKFIALLEQTGYRTAVGTRRTQIRATSSWPSRGLGIVFGPVSFEERSLVVARELIGVPLDPLVSYPDTSVAWREPSPPTFIASELGTGNRVRTFPHDKPTVQAEFLEGLAELNSSPGCDGRSEARTQGQAVTLRYWPD